MLLNTTRRSVARSPWLPMASAAIGLCVAGAAHAQAAPGATQDRRVDINEYDVSGNTLLSVIEVQSAVYPFEGPGRPVDDTDKARAALQKAYENKGYQAVTVVLPTQSVVGGVVKLQVIEARTAKITVTGRKYVSEHEVLDGLPALKPGQSPDFKALNSQLVDLNTRSADLQVTPQLKPGATGDTLDVDLDVEDKSPLHGGLELNNSYSRDTHPLRLQANISYDDLWHMGHSFSALYDVAPQDRDDSEVYSFTYSAPLPFAGVRLALTGLVSNSDVTTLGSTGVLGKGDSVTLSATMPLPTVGKFNQSVQASFAYKRFVDEISQAGQTDDAPVTYFPITATYNAGYRGEKDLVSASATVNFAFRGVGSDHDAFDNKRFNAQGNFVYLHATASWQHDLPLAAQIYGEVDGQIANEPLISNEQYAVGGEGSVRGYLLSDGLGDEGAHATIELRSPPLEHWMDPQASFWTGFRVYVFGDYGRAMLLDSLPQQQSSFDLASTGVGFTALVLKRLHFDVDAGVPLEAVGATSAYRTRFDFRLYSNF
jgi:hemolysin activation/secretion protein